MVIFGAAGSEVRHNTIVTRARVGLGGINLVDRQPWNGDYTGVNVHHNEIHALGSMLKIGIAIGHGTWRDDTEFILHGATVTDNVLYGAHFGYGMVVSSVDDFTVLRNTVDDSAAFDAVLGYKCPTSPPNTGPTPLLYNRGSVKGVIQSDFVNGNVQSSALPLLF